jgi:hypothetical protein
MQNVMAWCFWLLLASLLVQPTQRSLSTTGMPSLSNRAGSDDVLRPPHASLFARPSHRELSSGNGDAGRDLVSVAIRPRFDSWDAHTTVPKALAVASARDFLSCRTAHPRAPPA